MGTPDNTDTNEIDYEKRFKDTQASYTKSQQALRKVEAERDTLKTLVPTLSASLTEEQKTELEDLKYSDPDAWRVKMNKVEVQARTDLDAKTAEAISEADIQFELSRRGKILEDFNANSDTPLTDDQLANDIPPRLVKQMEAGEITFEDLVTKAHKFINSPKAIKGTDDTLDQPSLDNKGSGTSDTKPDETASKKYANSVY
ncbi:MAG: hypothetical protein DRG27_03555 [Deltaproteobacteria bacterium]|nr:MAG: hypothetical protein DRG27_03555 [Deltaproteobacteria bacterium]